MWLPCTIRLESEHGKYEADSDQDNFETGMATHEDAVSNDRKRPKQKILAGGNKVEVIMELAWNVAADTFSGDADTIVNMENTLIDGDYSATYDVMQDAMLDDTCDAMHDAEAGRNPQLLTHWMHEYQHFSVPPLWFPFQQYDVR